MGEQSRSHPVSIVIMDPVNEPIPGPEEVNSILWLRWLYKALNNIDEKASWATQAIVSYKQRILVLFDLLILDEHLHP